MSSDKIEQMTADIYDLFIEMKRENKYYSIQDEYEEIMEEEVNLIESK